jgi:AcrR family transcriptional regulator
MQPPVFKDKKRPRLTAEARRAQIVEAAAALAVEHRHLPVPLPALSASLGVSKALVYARFSTQFDLFNAVLSRAFAQLAEAGLDEASRRLGIEAAARDCALIYFDHVAARGPLIHIVLRDRYMTGRVDVANRAFRDRIILRLARQARRTLNLTPRDVIAAANMLMAIPEELGRLAFAGDVPPARARAICGQLVASGVRAFEPA